MPRKAKKARPFDAKKEIRAIARERVGQVKAARVIQPKSGRKPKYRADLLNEQTQD